jgi:hypothetical protein
VSLESGDGLDLLRLRQAETVVTRRRWWLVIAALAAIAILTAVVRNQIKVYKGRQARAEAAARANARATPRERLLDEQRQKLFELLQPVSISNCRFERFGEPHDGGYLMCGNLLDGVAAGYSYGISGYDGWGCDVSVRLGVPVHQYDCFDHTRPPCTGGVTRFHEECVGDRTVLAEGRRFDTLANQIAHSAHRSRRIVLKMDVEGAEWDALYFAPDELLARVDQLVIEFHWGDGSDRRAGEKYLQVVRRLKRFFEIAHLHFNNASCIDGLRPFPSWAFEVLFVSNRLAVVDRSITPRLPHPLDAPNFPALADCQSIGTNPAAPATRLERESSSSSIDLSALAEVLRLHE